FSVDTGMAFFAVVTWLFAQRIVESGRLRDYLFAGAGFGSAMACKYSALFLLVLIGIAHLLAPNRPRQLSDGHGWLRWIGRGIAPILVGVAVFIAVDPMSVMYFAKFKDDINRWIIAPHSGAWLPIYITQFVDVNAKTYWFTNLLWWGLGPALEVWGLL